MTDATTDTFRELHVDEQAAKIVRCKVCGSPLVQSSGHMDFDTASGSIRWECEGCSRKIREEFILRENKLFTRNVQEL